MAATDTPLAPLSTFHWYWWPHWSEDSSCVWDSPPPWRTLPFPSHRARRDKGLPDMKSCRPKVWAEEGKRRKEGKNGGSLSCGALPLKASWPAICAGSLAIATTPGRERGERQPGKEREGGWDGGKGEEGSGSARQDGVDGKFKAGVEGKITGGGIQGQLVAAQPSVQSGQSFSRWRRNIPPPPASTTPIENETPPRPQWPKKKAVVKRRATDSTF